MAKEDQQFLNDHARAPFSTELRWSIVISALGAIMSLLDSTIVNVALHTLSAHFDATLVTIQWVVTSYLLALAAVIPMTGWAARRVGVKRLYLAAVAVFAAVSLLCGLAGTVEQLIVLRVVQGAAGGVIASVGQMLLVMRADRGNMARVMSAVGVPMIVAPVVGPAIGGLLVDGPGWRWIFFINLPVGVVTVLLGHRFLPGDQGRRGHPLDLIGLVLAGLGMVGITYGLAEIGARGEIGSPNALLPMLAGALLIAAFVVRSLRVPHPLLDLRLYRSAAFSSASLTTFCSGAAIFGAMILLPIYLQSVRAEDALSTGLLLVPQGLGAAVGMYLSGRATDRLGAGATALIGGVLMTVTSIPLAFLTETTSYWLIGAVTSVRGVGIGLITMPAMTAAFRALSPAKVNDAAPQLNMLQRVGGSVGTAIFAVVLQWRLNRTTGFSAPGERAAAFAVSFWWVVGVTVAATVPMVLLMRIERRRAPEGARMPAQGPAQGTDGTFPAKRV
jgi:EmrB/QacA subfamily drug resistance transporter